MKALTIAAIAIAWVGLAALAAPTSAQNTANVSVDAYKKLGTMPQQGLGLAVEVWDPYMMDASVPGLIRGDGFKILRYPGGSYADLYHWQTNSATQGVGATIQPQDTLRTS